MNPSHLGRTITNVGGWQPWRELRRRDHIVFRLTDVAALAGGAAYYRRGDRAAIIIDPTLDQQQRRAALTHELIHDERGAGACHSMPASWRPVASRAEESVDNEVARRLVPAGELMRFCEARESLGLSTSSLEAAEEFEVPESVATRALRTLLRRDSSA